MNIDGSCHCGAVRYEADIDPARVRICHCTDCQVLSGSAFRIAVPTDEKDFRLTAGKPKIYLKTSESGARRAQAFCAECGTAIYATSVGDGPKTIGIRASTARQRAELIPRRQFWHRSALPWLGTMECLETYETQ
jgi:hypothetical protein